MLCYPLFLSLLAAPSATPVRLALIIANNDSLDAGVRPLHYADDDGARVFELLSGYGYDARLLTVLDSDTAAQHPHAAAVARPPSWDRLARTVAELAERARVVHESGGEVELVVTYSGHGAVGARGDPYINLLDRRLYRGDFFREVVAAAGADFVHLVVDACRARDFVDARGGPDGPDFDRELSLFLSRERRSSYPHVGVVVAESADGETHEWSRTHSGIFAHEVVSGLAGGADVNDDGVIEYSELHAFVSAANQAIRDPRARLRVVAEPPALNPRRPLVTLAFAPGVERIRTPMNGGRFTIEDDTGVRWVDIHQAAGSSLTLYLPKRPRYFVIDVTNSQEVVVEGRDDGAAIVISELAFVAQDPAVPRGSITAALASDLFRDPFGPSFYEGFVVAMRYPSVLAATPAAAASLPAIVAAQNEELANAGSRAGARESGEQDIDAIGRAIPLAALAASPGEDAAVLASITPNPSDASSSFVVGRRESTNAPGTGQAAPWTKWRVGRYVTGFGALTFGSVGMYLGTAALGARDEAKTMAVADPEYRDKRDQAERLALSADVMFALAAGGLISWGVSWFFDHGP